MLKKKKKQQKQKLFYNSQTHNQWLVFSYPTTPSLT